MSNTRQGFPKALAALAVAIGIAGGSYGIAAAASGNSSSSNSSSSTAAATQPAASSQPWGGQRSDETLLTGDVESKVRAAALAEVSGGTIIRVETDADGHAAYEAHMTKSDGTPVTVYVDKSYNVVSVESR
jgi:Peptidase propeptide and YPEB domain